MNSGLGEGVEGCYPELYRRTHAQGNHHTTGNSGLPMFTYRTKVDMMTGRSVLLFQYSLLSRERNRGLLAKCYVQP